MHIKCIWDLWCKDNGWQTEWQIVPIVMYGDLKHYKNDNESSVFRKAYFSEQDINDT